VRVAQEWNVTQPTSRWDLWTLPAYLLWLVFFLVGFDPELAFQAAREFGLVVSQNALVNSPHLITLSLSGYLGFFTFQRSLEAGLNRADAKARGLQFAILGLIAFLAFSPFQLLDARAIPVAKLRLIVIFVGGTKLFIWFMLLGVIARYYLLGHVHVFSNMVSVMPSTYMSDDEEPIGENSSVTWIDGHSKPEGPPPPPGPGAAKEQ